MSSSKLVRPVLPLTWASDTSIIVSWIWAGIAAYMRSMFMILWCRTCAPFCLSFYQAHSVHICPISVKEYQITSLSLTAAIANGISVDQIIKVLVKLSKNTIEASQNTTIYVLREMPGEKIGIQAMKRSLIKTWLWASICLALLVPRLRCPFF